ncbi:2-C-methyl-D-erythritol 4-phosphate cytidylyltransferase [Paenibacillus cymbidii]|uniref:2-C-methyl-D-erythritol 4-phosphate cytidylyltransferase n=1 Tax=Paenibacillus cymbidii TaxID=1639034 RepID=UPI001081BE42|nr:2-C-methyl-D-erythritol 4-phosphate cytidylyltransferase [Paenibacillus cymbidii]
MEKLAAVVVAAGKGSRMGAAESKQFLPLAGKPIVAHTLELFQSIAEVDEIVVVTGADDVDRCRAYGERYGIAKLTAVVPGGAERQASVYAGLRALGDGVRGVLVHDAVRPFAPAALVRSCWEKARECGAAVLAVPVKDTIKVVDGAGRIESTPNRSSLWSIQTPQAFRLPLLLEAYERAEAEGFAGTDDAMLVERLGHAVHVVMGSYENIKITTPEDLVWAERLLEWRGETKA